jgi:hypothetical protein
VYSGIAYMPEHPDSDMHGLLRVVIQERSIPAVMAILEKSGITFRGLWTANIWQVSKSRIEQLAAERHYGELLACPLVLAYLKPENYKPKPKSLLRRKP